MDADIQNLLFEAEKRLQAYEPEAKRSLALNNFTVTNLPNIPKLSHSRQLAPYVQHQSDLASIGSRQINDHIYQDNARPGAGKQKPKSISKTDKPTSGSDWFDLPKTELTPELKRDLQLLRMRSILDPKRHYKKENGKAQLPKYSQVGTIIEGPTEFFTGRISKKERKKTFVEEALAMEQVTKRFETKYKDIQSNKKSGRKSYYKGLQALRSGKRNRR